MARVESWAPDFFARHVERIPRPDWPGPDQEFWATFRAVLAELRATPEEADRASYQLAIDPPEYNTLDRHLPAFLAKLRVIQRTAAAPEPLRLTAEDRARWDAWESLPESERESRVATMSARYPYLARWRGWILALCQDQLLGTFDPASVPAEWRHAAPPEAPKQRARHRREGWLKEPVPDDYGPQDAPETDPRFES